jgi:hypothetical protein
MIINSYVNQKEHPGNQPIRVLRHNIAYSFQNIHPDIIGDHDRLKARGHIKDNINYQINEYPIFSIHGDQTPYIENGEINIHEIFLTYLWCISFSLHIPFFELVHRKKDIKNNPILLNEVNELFKFGLSLKDNFYILNKNNRFNPELFDETYIEYICITNSIYVMALDFILCHEYSHAKFQLFNKTKLDEERADFEAGKLIITGSKDQNTLGNRAIGSIVGLASILLLSYNVSSKDHPDSDKRIFNFIEQLPFSTDENNEVWAFACFVIAYWDRYYSISLDYNEDDLKMSYKQRFINLINQ